MNTAHPMTQAHPIAPAHPMTQAHPIAPAHPMTTRSKSIKNAINDRTANDSEIAAKNEYIQSRLFEYIMRKCRLYAMISTSMLMAMIFILRKPQLTLLIQFMCFIYLVKAMETNLGTNVNGTNVNLNRVEVEEDDDEEDDEDEDDKFSDIVYNSKNLYSDDEDEDD